MGYRTLSLTSNCVDFLNDNTDLKYEFVFKRESNDPSDYELPTKAKLVNDGEFTISMEADRNLLSKMYFPQINLKILDAFHQDGTATGDDGSFKSLFYFLTNIHDNDYESATYCDLYINDVQYMTYIVDNKTIKYSIDDYILTFDIVPADNFSNYPFRVGSVAQNPLGITDSSEIIYYLIDMLKKCFKLITGKEIIDHGSDKIDYVLNDLFAVGDGPATGTFDEILIDQSLNDTLYGSVADANIPDVKTFMSHIANLFQFKMGFDEYLESYCYPKVRLNEQTLISSSSILDIKLSFYQKMVGSYGNIDWGYVTPDEETAGTVTFDDAGAISNSDVVNQFYSHMFYFNTLKGIQESDFWLKRIEETVTIYTGWDNIKAFKDGSTYLTTDSAVSFMCDFDWHLFLNKIVAACTLRLKGISWNIFETYKFNFYFVNGTHLTYIFVPTKVTKNPKRYETSLEGYVLSIADDSTWNSA